MTPQPPPIKEGMMRAFLIALCLAAFAGTIQQDPIFRDNFIIRDHTGKKTGYMVRDAILKKNDFKNYLIFDKDGKKQILQDPILNDQWKVFDK